MEEDERVESRCSIFRVFADLLLRSSMETNGGVAQLGEHLLCKQGVHGFEPRHLHQPKGDSKDSRKEKKARLPRGKETGCKGS